MRLSKIFNGLSLCLVMLGLLSCSHQSEVRTENRSRDVASMKTLAPEISILVWNVYKGNYKDAFFADAYELMKKRDLVLFQEVVDNSEFENLYRGADFYDVEFSQSWGSNGVSTLSNIPSLESIALRSTVREVFFTTPKSGLITIYPIIDQHGAEYELLVLNVHMINFRGPMAVRQQLNQYREFFERHEGPIIAGGDFNTWSNARRDAVDQFFSEFNLEEISYKDAEGNDPRAKFLVGTLDRIYQRGLEVISTEVYTEIETSDHYPFSARLRLIAQEELEK